MEKKWKRVFKYVICAIIALIWLVPFFYIIITSVKKTSEFYMYGVFSMPHHIEWENFAIAWKTIKPYFFNSAVITLVSLPLLMFIGTLAAYALSRFRFKFSGFFTILFLLGFMIPVHATIFPLFSLFKDMGLLNSYLSLILTNIAFGLPFTIYLVRGYFVEIPREIEESACIDGCSSFRIYAEIIIPLSKPVLLIATLLNFMNIWNEFFFASTFIQNSDRMPVTVGLNSFVEEYSANYNLMTAGMLISILPVLILFICFQKYIITGMTEGAVKG